MTSYGHGQDHAEDGSLRFVVHDLDAAVHPLDQAGGHAESDPASPPPFIGLVYRGYHFTAAGSFFGLVWGFVDGLIGGAIFAWLYNLLAGKKELSA